MNESGINSLEEFLLFYLFAGFIVGSLWVILEADVTLSPIALVDARRRRARRIARALAPLGLVHVGFALLATDFAKSDVEEDPSEADDRSRRRARAEAWTFVVLGSIVTAFVAARMSR